jgi:hypothetical protein
MAAEGCSVLLACRVLAVSESGFYAQRHRPPSARAIRHAVLTDLIGRVHLDSRGTYGARRVHAELTLGHGLSIGHCAVELLMHRAGLAGVSGRPRFRRIPNVATASDLVERRFWRDEPDRLWVTDITEHPTREGKVYCAVSSTSSPVGSWGGRSMRRRRLPWSPTPSGWPSRGVGPTGRSSTPIRAPRAGSRGRRNTALSSRV